MQSCLKCLRRARKISPECDLSRDRKLSEAKTACFIFRDTFCWREIAKNGCMFSTFPPPYILPVPFYTLSWEVASNKNGTSLRIIGNTIRKREVCLALVTEIDLSMSSDNWNAITNEMWPNVVTLLRCREWKHFYCDSKANTEMT